LRLETHARRHARTHTHTRAHTHTHTHPRTDTHARPHAHTHARAHTRTHTHTHTHLCLLFPPSTGLSGPCPQPQHHIPSGSLHCIHTFPLTLPTAMEITSDIHKIAL